MRPLLSRSYLPRKRLRERLIGWGRRGQRKRAGRPGPWAGVKGNFSSITYQGKKGNEVLVHLVPKPLRSAYR